MNIDEAVKRAMEEETLLDALTFGCIWESERIVKEARGNETWHTCFKITLDQIMTEWDKKIATN